MNESTPVLTAGNISLLKALLDRRRDGADAFALRLRRKLDEAVVVQTGEVPPDVVTIGTRVGYRTGDGTSHVRTVSDDPKSSIVGGFLSVATPLGLALLGLSEGHSCRFEGGSVTVERVHFQPEANMRARRQERAADTPENRRASFRVIAKPRDDGPPAAG